MKAFWTGLPGARSDQASIAVEVSSVPLSETMPPGQPRTAMILSSSRATRMPETEVSTTSARHSRVQSDRQDTQAPPIDHLLMHEVDYQRWFGLSGSGSGERTPMARLRPPRRRTISRSSLY